MEFEKIRSETREHGVLLVTLDDPATLNALGEPLMSELVSEIDRFASDLIVMGSRAPADFGSRFLAPLAEQVAETAPCAVLTVPL